jgi:hypothetical protein
MDFRRVKLISLLIATLFLTGAAASTNYAVNSMDWKDVHAGMQHAFSQGSEEVYFARSSDASGLTTLMPKGDGVTILESEERPYTENLDGILESKGYTVENTTEFQDATTELAGGDNFIVVSESYPSAAVAVMPLANQLEADVVIANTDNIDQVEQLIQDADGDVILAGVFRRDLMNTLEEHSTEQIIEPNKFELSVKLTERYLEEKPETQRVFVTDGSKLESDLIRGENPILISGTNLIPEPVDQFLFQNPEHNLQSAVMVGNEMTTVGQEVSDRNITRNGETTDEQMDVFIKYGQARGDSSQIYALSMFPLPTDDIDLRIGDVRYEPNSKRLIVNYRNMGQSKMYSLTTMRITSNGEEAGSTGDENPIFISGNSTRTVEYQTNLTPEEYENAVVEFSTSYGETPDNLDTYLTEEGRFSPPVEKQIQVEEVEDNSSLELENVVYLTDIQRMKIDVKNTGNVTAHFSAVVEGLTVRGIEEDFSTETEAVEPGETATEYIPVELDSVDQEENDQVSVSLRYGEDPDLKVNSNENQVDFKTSTRSLTSRVTGSPTAGLVVITLLILAGLVYKREMVSEKISDLR